MTAQPFRAQRGGNRIDRSRPQRFWFDDREYQGFEGDTLASALLANGVRVAGRSFKLHRPRGLLAAGVEEPNVLVQIGEDGRKTTNLRATEVPLADGLNARPLNAWPSLRFDLGSINGSLSRFLKAGFYYKTFMWPHWHAYEGAIRHAAGIGRPSTLPDPDRYVHRHVHCDVLVIGSGPAGIAAARVAARTGARAILVEQDARMGGSALWRGEQIDGVCAERWAANVLAEIASAPEALLLPRTTAIAHYDHGLVALLERVEQEGLRERLWLVRARRIVLATGALERPLIFANNDRPGVMLASAALRYASEFGAMPGRRVVVATDNDSAYVCADQLAQSGVDVAAIVDTRGDAHPKPGMDTELLAGARIERAIGRAQVRGAIVRDASGRSRSISCDAILMSGGWNPDVQLFSQARGQLHYDEALATFRPGTPLPSTCCAGAANGCWTTPDCVEEGAAAGAWAIGEEAVAPPLAAAAKTSAKPVALPVGPEDRAFVDFQNDVTVADIRLAARENFVSVEHLKRYTTLGMAVDQGKTSSVTAIALMGRMTGRAPGEVGTTGFRPPYTPTALGALRGLGRRAAYAPFKRSPLHDRHEQLRAGFEDYGGWTRPAHYLRPGEDRDAAMRREALAVRHRAGLFDATPLGKIEVSGPDAGTFLDRIYANRMSNLGVGRVRYGLMLSELGVIVDDGVVARMADDRFLVGSTSAGADRVAAMLEEWLQCEWRDLSVIVAPVTTCWGNITLAGPDARKILDRARCDIPLDNESFPHLSWREASVAGLNARIARVSFSGELSYEISVDWNRTPDLWDALTQAAEPFGGAEPVGIDTWMLLRLEKGFLHVGADTEGTTVPDDVGWTKVAARAGDFVGKRSLLWAVNREPGRLQLVGLEAVDGRTVPPVGAHFASDDRRFRTAGFVTSAEFSPILHRPVALALVRGGRSRLGDVLRLVAGGAAYRVVQPCFYDQSGERMHG